jgi:FlaA1/EpsC-like NDP-sugar epimerase
MPLSFLTKWLHELPQIPRYVRVVLVALAHLMLFVAAFLCSWMVRFEFAVPEKWETVMWRSLPIAVGLKLGIFGLLGMFQGWWKYVSLKDILSLARALLLATGVLVLTDFFIQSDQLPRSIYVLDFLLSMSFIGGARGGLRLLREAVQASPISDTDRKNLLILGAGDTGETLLREVTKNRNLPFKPIGLLDDNPYKHGLRIHGVPVLGAIEQIDEAVEKHKVDHIVIAMPSANRDQVRRVVSLAKATGVKTQILPAVEAILEGHAAFSQVREVSLEDLLGRDPVRLDTDSVDEFIEGRVVLVTGAGGSIGSELCRQVMRFSPRKLILVERAETPLYFIDRELRDTHDVGDEMLQPEIANVCDEERMRGIFAREKPEVVIHAAAYKHVPLMERHPSEAVLNNVRGTKTVADLAAEFSCGGFVLVSTDKAVNPTSVMGATKRVTELYIQDLNRRADTTEFCSVRFGNVLGSNGSVVPIFRQQIEDGGPVTVTHPDMTRYFMTIPEASQLVLQAAALGNGGELFILDMGEPVKILDLAKDLIRLSGLTEDDVEITFTGKRPGEKLYEELTLDQENVDDTRHEKIFISHSDECDFERLDANFPDLLDAAGENSSLRVRKALKTIIPSYAHPEIPDNVVHIDDSGPQTPVTKKGPGNLEKS